MTKEESLAFLQECIDKIENASDEEIGNFKKAYENEMLNYKYKLKTEEEYFRDYLSRYSATKNADSNYDECYLRAMELANDYLKNVNEPNTNYWLYKEIEGAVKYYHKKVMG